MKIYIPTDFSDCAKDALKFAIKNFGSSDNEFFIEHCIQVPHAGATVILSIEDTLMKEAEKDMEALKKDLMQSYGQEKLNFNIRVADLPSIAHKFKSDQFDLIVMGTTGASGLMENFLGSTASKVVSNAVIPVIAVPAGVDHEISKMMFATDFKNDKFKSKVEKLAYFVEKLKCKLSIFYASIGDASSHIKDNPPEFEVLHEKDIEYELEIDFATKSDLEECILDNAKYEDADMLAVIPHHEGFLQSIFHKSMTRQLTMHTDIPILIVK